MKRYIYFAKPVGAEGPIKIGISRDVSKRLSEMNTGPIEIEIIAVSEGGFREERQLHVQFAPAHVRGSWFSPTPELLALISGVIDHGSIGLLIDWTADGQSPRGKSLSSWYQARRMVRDPSTYSPSRLPSSSPADTIPAGTGQPVADLPAGSNSIDAESFAAWRESQGQPIDAEPSAVA